MSVGLCARESCPIERRAKSVQSIIARDKINGLVFGSIMEMGETCGICGRARRWEHLTADNSVRVMRSDAQPSPAK